MARRNSIQSIAPFPPDIDRDAFGHWLSGFTDGEGCFRLQLAHITRDGRSYDIAQPNFIICLRDDDTHILELIQSFWRCGSLKWYSRRKYTKCINNPQCHYRITSVEDLENVLIPHFTRYPLRAKKLNDFLIWKEAVLFAAAIKRRPWVKRPGKGFILLPKWTDEEKAHFRSLLVALKQQRRYV